MPHTRDGEQDISTGGSWSVEKAVNKAHQFPGTYSCLSGSQNLFSNQTGINGQHLCNELYQLEGRDTFSPTVQTSSGDMGNGAYLEFSTH